MTTLFIREESGRYIAADSHAIRVAALRLAEAGMRQEAYSFDAPDLARRWLVARFAGLEREEFVALWLDSQHRLIETETVATGTINQAAVYPRELVKSALRHNAASVIFAHNHPSGVTEPSGADRRLTDLLASALKLVDVRALDHVVVAGTSTISFAERGWL